MNVAFNCITRRILKVKPSLLKKRNIMASTPSTQKAIEELQKNPYFEKYAKKIDTLQKSDPEEFCDRVETKLNIKNKNCEPVKEKKFTALLKPKPTVEISKPIDATSLDKIMKLDLIRDKDVAEIKAIWEKYHLQKNLLSATIPSKDYEKMNSRAQKHPMFIFPLPRSQGYEFILSQFNNNSVHFTPLICYQVHKENAPECLTLFHYSELKEKGIILMRGEYDENVIDAKEAQCLANQFQLYYAQEDQEKINLLELFTTKPDEFKHTDLIKQIETLSLH